MPLALDDLDRILLGLLQRDCSRTLFDLGLQVGLSTSAVQRRIRRYERARLIDRQVAVLKPGALGDVVVALVLVTLERESTELHARLQTRLAKCPEVQQCYDLASEHDYAVIVVARGMSDLGAIVDGLFTDDPNVKRYVTMPVYDVVKASLEIPIS